MDAEGRPLNALCYGGGNTAGEIEVSTCLTHHGARLDFDTETFVTHTLAFDCKQDGRGAEDLACVEDQGCRAVSVFRFITKVS